MKALNLDKRVVMFALFSLPVILILLISYIMNSRPIYEGSKASESSGTGLPALTVTPAQGKFQIRCLSPQVVEASKTVDLAEDPEAPLTHSEPAKVYQIGPVAIQYLSLVASPLPETGKPLTIIKTDLIEHGSLVRFVAVQGQSETIPQSGSVLEERLRLTGRECQAVLLE